MPDKTIYTFFLPALNQPVHGLLESGRTIHTHRLAIITENTLTGTLPAQQTSYFVTTANGSRYTLIVLPVSEFHAWLVDLLGISIPQTEVITI